jgi:GT2 family glycosyltransferase
MEAPIFIGELELTEPVSGITLPPRADSLAYTGARLLVRIRHTPIGYVFLPPDALASDAIAREIWRQLSVAINDRRLSYGLPAVDALSAAGLPAEEMEAEPADEGSESPMVSVVVCTRDRPDSVMVTLRTLVALRYRPFEIVVVDNAPSSDATKMAIEAEFGGDSRVRYVREPRPGLSCARNRGLAEAAADIVAFTDDDIRVDPWWLHGLVRGFGASSDVACVIGLVSTAEIANSAQLYFELRINWGERIDHRIFDLTDNRGASPLYPYFSGLGIGGNSAVSRRVLKEVGGFDEALGAGTPSGGGEDLEMFTRVILSGHRIVYEPSAIVWHSHRVEVSALAKQMTAYGSGCTAALTAIVLRHAQARREIPRKAASSVLHIFHALRDDGRMPKNSAMPRDAFFRERAGMLVGPWLYMKGRRRLRRVVG